MREAILYKVTNIINNKCYFGIIFGKNQTPEKRFEEHMSGRGGKLLYKHGVKKYGRENFKLEILEKGELDYIRNLEVQNNRNNLYPIGYNGNVSHAMVLTPEQKQQALKTRSEMHKLYPEKKPVPPTWKGKKRSETMRKKLSASKMGHTVSEEARKKISNTLKGRKHTQETITKRRLTLLQHPTACGKQHWLAISSENVYHYTHGKAIEMCKKIGVARSKAYYKNMNTGLPLKSKRPMLSKCEGWTFYNDEKKIKQLLEQAKFNSYQIITYGKPI